MNGRPMVRASTGAQLELARIGTIHAFCGDLLRERPVEAGIDPLFEVAAEDQGSDLMDRAFDNWFQSALADPPEGMRRILRRRSKQQQPREALRNAAANLAEHRDFPTPWRRDPFDRPSEIDELIRRLTAFCTSSGISASVRTFVGICALSWLPSNAVQLCSQHE